MKLIFYIYYGQIWKVAAFNFTNGLSFFFILSVCIVLYCVFFAALCKKCTVVIHICRYVINHAIPKESKWSKFLYNARV